MTPDEDRAQRERLHRAWAVPRGWRYFSEVNNDQVGNWYLATAFAFFLFAGVLGLLMRVQLAVPDNDFLSAGAYHQIFTVHGSAMMFLFAVPVFEAFSIRILPALLGARDLPFPRLSAYGYWSFLIGGVFFCGSLLLKVAPEGGWFMYPPLTTRFQDGPGADIWLLALSFIEIASIAAAVELIVGILRCRPPGMRLHLMPLYAWYLLVTAAMILFAFPPLIAGDLLFELERSFDWPFFDAARGGDPLLWQHLFWIFGHPEVYIVFLPSVGLVAMLLPSFARRPVLGYRAVVMSAVAVGFLGFGLWVHHLYTTGLPGISLGFFSAASQAVAIPTAIQIFCLLATVLTGRLVPSVPMLYLAGALAIFVLGGLTGVMLAIAPFDFQAHDTYFVVAHLHYVLFGGMLLPILAAVIYYYPLIAGRQLSPRLGRWAFWLIFGGFNLAFLPMHVTGLGGMARRLYTYPAGQGFEWLNAVSTVGAFVLAAGVVVFLADLLRPGKRRSPPDPWRAGTLEWLPEQLPDHPWGLRSIPRIDSRMPLWDQPQAMAEARAGGGLLPDAEEGRRETLITSVIDAEPQQCLRVGMPGFVPLVAAVFTGGAFIAPVFHAWGWTLLYAALALATILYWLWTGTGAIPEKPAKLVGQGLVLPLYAAGPAAVGWWALLITLIADLTAFASLLFGFFFYWTVRPDFLPAVDRLGPLWPLLALAASALGWAAVRAARWANAAGRGRTALTLLAAAAALALAGAAALLEAPRQAGLDPVDHVYPATVWLLAIWTALHLALGALMALYAAARRLAGRLDARHDAELQNAMLYWHFLLPTAALTVAVMAI